MLCATAVLAAIMTAGTVARSEISHHILIGVLPDTCFLCTVNGDAVAEHARSDELGILLFSVDTDGMQPGLNVVHVEAMSCDTAAFTICPGECGITPKETRDEDDDRSSDSGRALHPEPGRCDGDDVHPD
ncbi:MAG: hypothetical protein OCU12_07120 [Methanophagales archaeon]|nr:hypothetical protein [Methanophagales archaeon]